MASRARLPATQRPPQAAPPARSPSAAEAPQAWADSPRLSAQQAGQAALQRAPAQAALRRAAQARQHGPLLQAQRQRLQPLQRQPAPVLQRWPVPSMDDLLALAEQVRVPVPGLQALVLTLGAAAVLALVLQRARQQALGRSAPPTGGEPAEPSDPALSTQKAVAKQTLGTLAKSKPGADDVPGQEQSALQQLAKTTEQALKTEVPADRPGKNAARNRKRREKDKARKANASDKGKEDDTDSDEPGSLAPGDGQRDDEASSSDDDGYQQEPMEEVSNNNNAPQAKGPPPARSDGFTVKKKKGRKPPRALQQVIADDFEQCLVNAIPKNGLAANRPDGPSVEGFGKIQRGSPEWQQVRDLLHGKPIPDHLVADLKLPKNNTLRWYVTQESKTPGVRFDVTVHRHDNQGKDTMETWIVLHILG